MSSTINLQKLQLHIIELFDNNDNKIIFNKIELKEEHSNWSNNNVIQVYVDNIKLTNTQKRSYKVIYKCRCGCTPKILLRKYLAKEHIVCKHCLQNRSFDYFSVSNNFGKNKDLYKGRKQVVLNKDLCFDDMNENFKQHFYKNHLSENEFYEYLPHIYKINNIVLTDKIRKTIQYKLFPTNNQTRFCYKISFDNGITFENIVIYLKCHICGKIHKVHIDNLRKKDFKNIKCSRCMLTNHRYKIKLYDDSGLTYQSNLEKQFIDKCKCNNIIIVNGLTLPYFFNNKYHNYITDFYLPEYKYIIEIKSDNIWYKNDVKSGKIDAKINAATTFSEQHKLKYVMLFDNDIDKFIANILEERDSLEIPKGSR